jgi:phasin family protein
MATKTKAQTKKPATKSPTPRPNLRIVTAESINSATKTAQTQFKSIGDKMQNQAEDFVAIAKGNYEAVVAATDAAKKGFETLTKVATDLTKTAVADVQSNLKTLTAVKTPKEFFDVQTSLIKTSYDKYVGDMSKFTELFLKVAGEVVEPVSNRAAIVMDKVTKKAA